MRQSGKHGTFRCECGCTFVTFDIYRWNKDASHTVDLEFWTHVGKASLRWRLKTAWRVLTGGDHYLDAVSVDEDQAKELRDFLVEKLP